MPNGKTSTAVNILENVINIFFFLTDTFHPPATYMFIRVLIFMTWPAHINAFKWWISRMGKTAGNESIQIQKMNLKRHFLLIVFFSFENLPTQHHSNGFQEVCGFQ